MDTLCSLCDFLKPFTSVSSMVWSCLSVFLDLMSERSHSFWCARYSSFPRHTIVHISYTLSSRPNFSICMWCVWSRIVDRKFSFGINCLLLFASSTWSVCYYTWCFQCLLRWGRELVWPDSNEPGGLSGSFQKKYKYIPCGTKTSSNKNSSHCVWSKKDGMRIFPQKVSA